MTSRSSFFDLMRENLKRRIALPALITVVFFFLFPVGTLMLVDNYMRNPATSALGLTDWDLTKRYIHDDFLQMQNAGGFLFVLIVLLAVVSGVNAFKYLHNARKTDFYHSLPVSRVKLYTVSVVNSLLMTGVPYLVMAMASAAITQVKTGYAGCLGYAFGNYLCGMGFFVMIFMTTVLAMLLTGNLFTGITGTIVFMFYGPVTVCTLDALMSGYFRTYYRTSAYVDELCAHTSPICWVAIGDGTNGHKAAAALIVGVVLFALCLKLYLMRRSEAAGTPMAFKLIKAPVKVLITVTFALQAGLFAGGMTDESDVWTVFGMLCGAVLVHSIIEIIYNADFRRLFSNRLQLALCIAATLLIWGFFRFDLSGYDSFLPDMAKTDSAAAYSYSMENVYGNEDYLTLNETGTDIYISRNREDLDVLQDMHIEDADTLEHVVNIAREGIESVARSKASGVRDISSEFSSDYEESNSYITIAWHQTNGRTVYRQYGFDLSRVSEDIAAVHDSLQFKEAVYPLLTKTDDEVADFVGVNYRDALGTYHIVFDTVDISGQRAAIKELYDTYTKELEALTADTRHEESPIASIQFKSEYFQSLSDKLKKNNGYIGTLNDIGDYPVYPSFTKTLALLESYGIVLNEGLDAEHIKSIELEDSYTYALDDGNTRPAKAELIVTDKEQIQEILDSVIFYVNTDNSLNPQYYGMYANVNFDRSADAAGAENGSDSKYAYFVNGISFDADKMPQFVKDYFEIDEDALALHTQPIYW